MKHPDANHPFYSLYLKPTALQYLPHPQAHFGCLAALSHLFISTCFCFPLSELCSHFLRAASPSPCNQDDPGPAGLGFTSSYHGCYWGCSLLHAWLSFLPPSSVLALWHGCALLTYPLLRISAVLQHIFCHSGLGFFTILHHGCEFCHVVGTTWAVPVLTSSPPGLLFYFTPCWHHMAAMATEYITPSTFRVESGLLKGSMLWINESIHDLDKNSDSSRTLWWRS